MNKYRKGVSMVDIADNDDYLDVKGAMQFLGIKSRNTLNNYVNGKKLTKYSSGVGRKKFFLKCELAKLKVLRTDKSNEQ
jgi:hypothetical protein